MQIAHTTIYHANNARLYAQDGGGKFFSLFVDSGGGTVEITFNRPKDLRLLQALQSLPFCNCLGELIEEEADDTNA